MKRKFHTPEQIISQLAFTNRLTKNAYSGFNLNRRHTDFQSVDEKSQPQQKQTLITDPEQRLQTSLQKILEMAKNRLIVCRMI